MIYYLIMPYSSINEAAVSYDGTHIGSAIKNHNDLGSKAPKIVNEVLCAVIVTDVTALKKINFTKDDEVRLALIEDTTRYGGRINHFDVNNVSRITDIYQYLKSSEVNVNSTVVYV